MSKISLSKPVSGYNLSAINDNFTALEAEFQNKVLYRNNPVGEPNSIETDIDLNGNDLLNVGTLNGTPIADLSDISAYVNSAAASAASAAASYDSFDDRYLGSKAVAPTLDNDGNTLITGALYWDSVGGQQYTWNGSAWIANSVPGGVVAIASGGTGSTTAANARTALGITPANIGAAVSGVNNDITSLTGVTSIGGGQLAGFRNRLINAAMLIAQRGTSGTVTAGTSTPGLETGYACVDRFYIHCAGANVTAAQVNGADATSKRLQVTGAASVTSVGIGQRIESVNSYDLAGKTCTLSVDIANSLLTSVTWTAYYANTADNFGMLAAPTKTQIATGTFTVNSSVSRYSAQMAIPLAAVTGVEIVFTVGAQTSGTWVIGNPQFEIGSVATSFEHRPYYLEMTLCQRYCELVSCLTETTANHTIYMKAAKFAPLGVQVTTVSLSSGTGFSATYITGGVNLTQNGANSVPATAVVRASSEIF